MRLVDLRTLTGAPLLGLVLLAGAAAAQVAGSGADPAAGRFARQGGLGAPAPSFMPPPAVPPPGLVDVPGGPLDRARAMLRRAEVLDSMGIRAARRVELAVPDLSDDGACSGARAAWSAMDLALAQGERWQRSAAALLDRAGTGDGDVAAALDTSGSTARRLAHLRGLRDDLGRTLAGARCAPLDPTEAPPLVFLPAADRAARDHAVTIYLHADLSRPVVWVDGLPQAVLGDSGWTAAVVPEGPVRLCAASPEMTRCEGGVEVPAEMGAAFRLPDAAWGR